MRHRYRDKLSGRTVELDESKTDFIALAADEDAETLSPLLRQNVFAVTPSTNRDRIVLLTVRSDAESTVRISETVDELRKSGAVEAVAPALIDDDGITRFVIPGRLMIQFAPGITSRAEAKLLEKHALAPTRRFRSPGLVEVEVAADQLFETIEALNSSSAVSFAEPSYYSVDDEEIRSRIAVGDVTDDAESLLDLPWNLRRIAIEGAWATTRGRPDVVVAVIDGWPDLPHDALDGKFLVQPNDQLTFSADRTPSGHATAISGLLAASAGAIAGVAPNVRLVPLVVNLKAQSYAERADAIRAATAAAASGELLGVPLQRLVLSCSWRTRGDIAVVRQALQQAVAAGVLVVCSAGNEDSSAPHYPSDYSAEPGALGRGVMCVAAVDQQDRRATYSNYSASVDLCAPGGDGLPFDERDILCADLHNGYAPAAGTSIAAPHVAAVAALVLSVNPALTPAEVKALLRQSADDISAVNPLLDGMLGTGRLNAANAVAAASRHAPNDDGGEVGDPPAAEDDDEPAVDAGPVEGGGPSATIDAIIADETPINDIETIRRELDPARDTILNESGWRLLEARFTRGSDSIAAHFDD